MTLPQPDLDVLAQARDRANGLATPVGALGRLLEIGCWVAACQGQCPPGPLTNVRAVVPAGDHGVVASGVASYPKEITPAMVRALDAGVAGMNVLAAQHGVPVRVLDIAVDDDLDDLAPAVRAHKLGRSCGDISIENAMPRDLTEQALATGERILLEEKDAGAQLLIVGDLGIGNTTPAAALAASRLGLSAQEVTGRGAGLDDDGLLHKTAIVQRALDRFMTARHAGDLAGAPEGVARLAALGSPDIAVAVGILLGAARHRVPVLLDGVISVTEALIAEELEPGAVACFVAGHRSPEPASSIVLDALGLDPLIDLGMRLGEGSGAMTALPLVRSGIAVLRDVAMLADLMPA